MVGEAHTFTEADDPAGTIYSTESQRGYIGTLNTLVGVQSIDPDHVRAARCLGATRRDLLVDIIIPGALPQIFTGLQIAMGAAWFSLAAGEMIAGLVMHRAEENHFVRVLRVQRKLL